MYYYFSRKKAKNKNVRNNDSKKIKKNADTKYCLLMKEHKLTKVRQTRPVPSVSKGGILSENDTRASSNKGR